MTKMEGIPADFHFGNDQKLKEYEETVFEGGKLTKFATPFLSSEDHLIRKLIRFNARDRTDVKEIIKNKKNELEKVIKK